ncbi:MAG: zinc-binding protein [Verrucomicrobiae bacterium]|nr:zinc-binding protein [Verrucomicrobiae bacterium]
MNTKRPLVYACSGCSDAGELADRIARRLDAEGAAEMSCLAGIGGRVRSLMKRAADADRIMVIDGCPLQCARHTLEAAGFREFSHLGLHEIGFRKGNCPVSPERIQTGVAAAREHFGLAAGGRDNFTEANTAPAFA